MSRLRLAPPGFEEAQRRQQQEGANPHAGGDDKAVKAAGAIQADVEVM